MHRRLLYALLCLATATALYVLFQPSAPTDTPQLLDDASGRIERVALVVNSARTSTLRNTAMTNAIINALPERSRVTLVAPDRDAFAVQSNPWRDRITWVDVEKHYRLTIWPQDPFLVLRDDDGYRLLVSGEFDRAEDSELGDLLATSLDWPAAHSKLSFEGGNIVADEQFVFIGANTIRANAMRLDQTDQSIARDFRTVLGKQVVVLGPVPQPIGHIDMMITPLGDKTLLLADPGWGARLAQQALANEPASVMAFEQRCMDNFFGDRGIDNVLLEDGERYRPPDLVGATAGAIADSQHIAPVMDTLRQQLLDMGFTVQRVPYLQQAPPVPTTTTETAPARPAPGYPQITYNNVLLENYRERGSRIRVVYLPQYGWEQFDRVGREVWEKLGYRVVPVPGFAVSAMYGGALRCSAKVLARSRSDQ